MIFVVEKEEIVVTVLQDAKNTRNIIKTNIYSHFQCFHVRY